MSLAAISEALALVFNLAYVVAAIEQKIWCWYVGLVGGALSLIVFLQARLYAGTALQVVYVVLMVYGWYQWRRGGEGGEELAVSRTPGRWRLGLALAGAVFALVLGYFLRHRTDGALAYWDAGTTSFSLVAQFMTSRKWLGNWLVWIVVDAVYVGMLVTQRLYMMALLYLAYLVLAVLGYLRWKKSMEGELAVEPA